MKKISYSSLSFIPASHEDSKVPGTVKKILFTDRELIPKTKVKMINWARILPGKKFIAHYHEDMDEIFIITKGQARIKVGRKQAILEKGDAVFIPMGKVHKMEDIRGKGVDYLVIGLSLDKKGKTIITENKA